MMREFVIMCTHYIIPGINDTNYVRTYVRTYLPGQKMSFNIFEVSNIVPVVFRVYIVQGICLVSGGSNLMKILYI